VGNGFDCLQADQEALVYLLGDPSPEEKLKDEKDIGRDGQKIGLECCETQSLDVEGKVGFVS
jgi:hypothetical protein